MTKLKGWVVCNPLRALFLSLVIFWAAVAATVALAVLA